MGFRKSVKKKPTQKLVYINLAGRKIYSTPALSFSLSLDYLTIYITDIYTHVYAHPQLLKHGE